MKKPKDVNSYIISTSKGIRGRFKVLYWLCVLAIVIFFIVVYVAIAINFKIDFLNINPLEQPHNQTIRILYPLDAIISNGNNTNPLLFSVEILLLYNGTLTEGTPVNVIADGFIYSSGKKMLLHEYDNNGNEIYNVAMRFNGAYGQHFGGNFYVTLQQLSSNYSYMERYQPESPILQTIYWNAEGDYYPIMYVPLDSGDRVIEYTEYKIHVSGSYIIEQEKFARINNLLSVALFFFAFIEFVKFSWNAWNNSELRKDDRNKDKKIT